MIGGRLGLVAVLGVAACASATRGPASAEWSVTVLGDSIDPRYVALTEAMSYWNEQLGGVGARPRFVSIAPSEERLPEAVLHELSNTVRSRERLHRPRELDRIPGSVVVALANSELVSVGISADRMGRALVVLRPGDAPPLSLPNVARNVAAHELGHVLGLNHNGEPGTLMCGPPIGRCLPTLFRSQTSRFFPLTAGERRTLASRWR